MTVPGCHVNGLFPGPGEFHGIPYHRMAEHFRWKAAANSLGGVRRGIELGLVPDTIASMPLVRGSWWVHHDPFYTMLLTLGHGSVSSAKADIGARSAPTEG